MKVRPYHWDCSDVNEKQHIHVWSLDKNNESVLLRVEDYCANMVIELPGSVQRDGCNRRVEKWTMEDAISVHKAISDKVMKREGEGIEPLQEGAFTKLQRLYYYTRKMVTCMVLHFKSRSLMESTFRILKDYPVYVPGLGRVMLKCHEKKISSVRKLITQRDISYTGWLSFNGEKIEEKDKISTCKHEYIVPWSTLSKHECDIIPKIGVLSFDIECYTHDYRIFPRKSDPRHVAYMISVVYHRLQTDEYHRYGIIYGDCNDIDPSEFPNTKLIKVLSETELVHKFAEVVNKHDPEIVTGYNILGFDYPYLDERLNLDGGEWPVMGRLKNIKSYMKSFSWSSSAYSFNSINNLIMPGRINVDMLNVVKRQCPSYPSFTLNYVSGVLLKENKLDITPKMMFDAYDLMVDAVFNDNRPKDYVKKAKDEMTDVMLYCIQDSELPIKLMIKLNTWVASLETSDVVGINIYDLYTRGQQVRTESLIYDFAYKKSYLFERRLVQPDVPFEGGFVNDPNPGIWEDVLVIDFASLYPTIIDGYNLCYTTLIRDSDWEYIKAGKVKGLTVDDCREIEIDCVDVENEKNTEEDDPEDQEHLEGERKSYTFRFVKKHIKEGILPQIVRKLCVERRRVRSQIYETDDPVQKDILDKRQLALKICCNSVYGFLGVKNYGRLSLIEAAVCTTKKGRDMIEDVNGYIVGEYEGIIVYGDTDSTMFIVSEETRDIFPEKDYDKLATDVAERYGFCREIEHYEGCEYCKYHVNKKDDDGNYTCSCRGLTDANEETCSCWKNRTNAEVCKYWGERISEEVTNLFPEPIMMEYEKGFSKFLSIKKKKYAGIYLGQDHLPIEECKMLYKGIMLARRDNCTWLKDVLEKVLWMCIAKEKFINVIRYVVGELENIYNGGVDWRDLEIVKKMGHGYKKTSNYHMKLFAEEMARIGKPIEPGTRVFYLVTERPDEINYQEDKHGRSLRKKNKEYKLGHKQVTREMYEENIDTEDEYKIDYCYYVGNLLAHHVDQLVSIVYKDVCDHISAAVSYNPTSRHKERFINKCVDLFHTMHIFGNEPREFLNILETTNILSDFENGDVYTRIE